jgi:hypothetical protein
MKQAREAAERTLPRGPAGGCAIVVGVLRTCRYNECVCVMFGCWSAMFNARGEKMCGVWCVVQ